MNEQTTMSRPRFHFPFPRHDRTPHVVVHARKCVACGRCVEACRRGVLGMLPTTWHRHAHVDDASACTGCLACVKTCPEGAIVSRKDAT